MLFTAPFWPGIRAGRVTVTYRPWARARAKTGGRHRFQADGVLEILSVERVRVADITDTDVPATGHASRRALLEGLAAAARRPLGPDDQVWRVGFRFVAERDPRLALGEAAPTPTELADLVTRLRAIDARAAAPWVGATLQAIADGPGVASSVLAPALGREKQPFKTDVRRLKRLGLTISLEVGYRLSVRGQAALHALG